MSISDNNLQIEKTGPEEKVSFGKALLEYCIELFKAETSRQDALESKSRFYLSFVTLLIGAFFLNLDFLASLKNIIAQEKPSPTILITTYTCIVILGISLFVSLFAIFFSVGVKSYKGVFPKDITYQLFGPTSKYIKKEDLLTLYKTVSMNYTVALEHNKDINDKKAKWINIAALSSLITISSLSVLLGLLGYIMFGS